LVIVEANMFGYKSASQSFKTKMGHGSSLCAIYLERIVKQLKKNHISQCKIAKHLSLSSSSIHNIVTRFRESREISVCAG